MAFFQLMAGDTNTSKMLLQWIIFIGIFMFVVPKLYFYQMFAKVEASARKLEDISKKGQKEVVTVAASYGKDKKQARKLLKRFVDFFVIPPVNLDPFGIMKKLEHLIHSSEDRFKDMSAEIAPKAGTEESMNVYMGLQAAVEINTIAKIVRHFVELVKKFKNLQFAMILQMQLPMIEKLVEAEFKGLKAFLSGKAIGDGIGPLVVASMASTEGKELTPEALVSKEVIWGRNILLVKAKGPGGRLGEIGDAVQLLCKKHKVAKIITIDAAQKLEGEKTGTVSEGVGAAIGGVGVQKAKIEEIAVKNKIPMEALAIKMSPFEAISPMPEDVVKAVKDAKMLLSDRVQHKTNKGDYVVVVGVGNTCGVDNTSKGIRRTIEKIEKEAKKLKREEEKKETKGWWLPKKKKKEAPESLAAQFWFGRMNGNPYMLDNCLKGNLTTEVKTHA
jgi:hypothetical protein